MKKTLAVAMSLFIGILLTLVLTTIMGESPVKVVEILVRGSFGAATQIGYTLYYATPLIFTGLSVAWSLRGGLFNIGAEGQMLMGGLAMTAAGLFIPAGVFSVPLALLSGFLGGAIWGGMAGWMKAYRNCHEVLATILLNFVAYGISSYFITVVLRDPASPNPETAPVLSTYVLSPIEWLGGQSALSTAFFIAIGVLAVAFVINRDTLYGLHHRLIGGSPGLATALGYDVRKYQFLNLAVAGGIAGLAAAPIILGYTTKAQDGFSSGNGFMGIAVAMLAMNSEIGVLLAAIFFGALTKGALDLDMDSRFLSRDLAYVIQAFMVLLVAMRFDIIWQKIQSMRRRWKIS